MMCYHLNVQFQGQRVNYCWQYHWGRVLHFGSYPIDERINKFPAFESCDILRYCAASSGDFLLRALPLPPDVRRVGQFAGSARIFMGQEVLRQLCTMLYYLLKQNNVVFLLLHKIVITVTINIIFRYIELPTSVRRYVKSWIVLMCWY